jgi:hypothetical protein
MAAEQTKSGAKSLAANVLTDIHFWVPVAVLLGGLLLLRLVS